MLVIAPAVEPVTLAETKLFLRVDNEEEDTLIAMMIASSRRKAEQYIRRSLITQRWKMAYDDYAPSRINLMRGPVQAMVMVVSVQRDGSSSTLLPTTYHLSANKDVLLFDAAPIGYQVELTYITGYGDAPSDVPEPIRQGMLCHIAHMYNERDGSLEPDGMVKNLYDDYRTYFL